MNPAPVIPVGGFSMIGGMISWAGEPTRLSSKPPVTYRASSSGPLLITYADQVMGAQRMTQFDRAFGRQKTLALRDYLGVELPADNQL